MKFTHIQRLSVVRYKVTLLGFFFVSFEVFLG